MIVGGAGNVTEVNVVEVNVVEVNVVEVNVVEVNVVEVNVQEVTVKNLNIMKIDVETVTVIIDQGETGQDRGPGLLNGGKGVQGHVTGDLRKDGDLSKEDVRQTEKGPRIAEDPQIDVDHPTAETEPRSAETGAPNAEIELLNADAPQTDETGVQTAYALQIADVRLIVASDPLNAGTSKTFVPTKSTVRSKIPILPIFDRKLF